MAKAAKKKPAKKRAEHYEEKVKFDGTFEQMIAISTTGAGAKKNMPNPLGVKRYVVSYDLYEGNKLISECNEEVSVPITPDMDVKKSIESNIKPNQRIESLSIIMELP